MIIKYKFNKSSEARDCVVEGVECTLTNDLTLNFVDLGVLWRNGETKQFTSQQELKEYINTIQKPIEFMSESDIDQVLMKEWIGEWNIGYKCDECNNRNVDFDCDYNLCCKKEIKTGSPKLNSNWTFKIK